MERHTIVATVHRGTVLVEALLVRDNGIRSVYEVRAPRYLAKVPACHCDRLAVCDALAEGKSCSRLHKACHRLGHDEYVAAFAAKVADSYRRKPPRRQLNLRPVDRRLAKFAPLDGDERIAVVEYPDRELPTRLRKATILEEGEFAVTCTSRRCRKPIKEHPFSQPLLRTRSEQEAVAAAQAHREWHTRHFPPQRQALDDWLDRHEAASFPKVDEDELRRQLEIARAERRATRR